jgi:mycothiol synthase
MARIVSGKHGREGQILVESLARIVEYGMADVRQVRIGDSESRRRALSMGNQTYPSRPFGGDDDLEKLRRFLVEVAQIAGPVNSGFHIGDLLWGRYMYEDAVSNPADRVQIWEGDDGDILGFAWLHPPAEVELNIHPRYYDNVDLLAAMLTWADEHRHQLAAADPPKPLATSAFADDDLTASLLSRLGFTRTDDPAMLFFTRSLTDPIPTPVLPDGFSVRSLAGESEYEDRVAMHCEVWHPSRVTVEAYRRLRTAPGYDPDLDLVAVAPDGTFAAYAILWHDPENGTGEFEPVGARPAYRGRGLTKAVLVEGLRRLRDRGADLAIVYTPESSEPARRLYESVGFRVVNRWQYWRRPDQV